jgi:hypothetical protein
MKTETIENIFVGFKEQFQPIASIKEAGDELIVEGYMAVFNNVDSDGEVMMPTAFDTFIDRFNKEVKTNPKVLKVLYRHRWDMPVGYVKEMRNDGKGVWVVTAIDETTDAGKYAANLIRSKEMRGFSYYYFNGLGMARDGIRYMQKVDVMEVTLTPKPANELALIKKFGSGKAKELYKVWKGLVLNTLRADGSLSDNESRVLFAQGVKGLDLPDDKVFYMKKILDGI